MNLFSLLALSISNFFQFLLSLRSCPENVVLGLSSKVPSLWSVDIISRCRHATHMGTDSTCSRSPYRSQEMKNMVEIILPSPICAEVVTYRLDILFLGPCTCSNSMVSMNCVSTNGSLGTALQRLTEKSYRIYY
jgi:hypothetical protein